MMTKMMNEKKYKWKETWRDSREFDWLCEMESCEDALYSLQVHIENCDKKHDGRSIDEAEGLMLDIQDEIDERLINPEWPTDWNLQEYCGKYPVVIRKEEKQGTGKLKVKWCIKSYDGTWNLTPELLKSRWTSEVDFLLWRDEQCDGLPVRRIEPMPPELINGKMS
jgi:hypothetical protein